MSNSFINVPPPSTYGAVELKVWIKKYTYRGFLYTCAGILLIAILYFGLSKATEKKEVKMAAPPVSKIVMQTPMQDQASSEEQVATQEAPPEDVDIATIAKAGNPVPVPDAEVTELKDFADFSQIESSLKSETGQIVNIDALPTNISFDEKPAQVVEVKKEEARTEDMDEFVPMEKRPSFDPGELARNIVYPEVAKKAGIEGTVQVSIWISKTGKPTKVVIRDSPSTTLNNAAKEAIMQTTFSPGIQNNQPVGSWLTIPVVFRLK